MTNIYAAPEAKLDQVSEDAPPATKPKAVLLLQVWSMVLMALFAVGFMKSKHLAAYTGQMDRTYVMGGLIAFILVTMFTLDKRMMAGRVLGLLTIALTSAPLFIAPFVTPMPTQSTMRVAYLITLGVFYLPFLYWAYAFSFSERARRFFAQDPDD